MFSKTFGCVRYLYNRMLDDKSKAYKSFGEKLNLTPAWYEHISYHSSGKYMYITLPKIPGEVLVKNHHPIKQGGKLKSVSVSREPSGKYYVPLLFEYIKVNVVHDIVPDNAIGLDMSMHNFYVDSDGNEVDSPHA